MTTSYHHDHIRTKLWGGAFVAIGRGRLRPPEALEWHHPSKVTIPKASFWESLGAEEPNIGSPCSEGYILETHSTFWRQTKKECNSVDIPILI
jgi:hypothetical protein